MFKYVTALFLSITALMPISTRGQVVINEVVSTNGSGVTDEEGDFPDWIELYNPTNSSVNLSEFSISDDSLDLIKYPLPNVEIETGGYFLLYASDKNREGFTTFWETKIEEQSEMRYIVPSSQTPSSWIDPGFDDSGWSAGSYGIGYGDNDDATQVPNGTLSIFTRAEFDVEDPLSINNVMLHVDYDDGYIAFLNGVEIARANMSGESPAGYNTVANTYLEPRLIYGQELDGILITEIEGLLVEGTNVLAIQVHNNSSGSSDITLIPFLSLGYSSPDGVTGSVAPETNLQASQVVYPHLNFKISSAGESIFLSALEDSSIVDELLVPELRQGESFGRTHADLEQLFIFSIPTPLSQNPDDGFLERLPIPELSISGGYHPNPVSISLTNSEFSDRVYYTTDGSEPTTSSPVFGGDSMIITSHTALRLRTIEDGKLSSTVTTQTYVIGTEHDLPIVAVNTNPDNLWDDETGIYVVGTNGISGNCVGPSNWNQDWEIPIHIELYEKTGELGFSSEAGAKIFGGCSRSNPVKSLSIFFRGEYGNAELDYKLFEEKDIDKFQGFVLRNSGNDFIGAGFSMFRDGMMKTLVEDTEIDYQAFRPVVVYLNGEYWGIHNIREKINEHFIESNSEADSDQIDLLENDRWVVHGSSENFDDFMNLLGSVNMTNEEQYAQVEAYLDIDNYIDYVSAQIYYGNTDWPGNNMRFWRDHRTNGSWRWIMYDTDFGFDLYDWSRSAATDNTLEFALDTNCNCGWPNPPWSTYMLRRMVQSPIFVQKFANRMADLMNTSFQPDYVHSVIDSLAGIIESEIPRQTQKWGNWVEGWESEVSRMKGFADDRPDNMESFFVNRFRLSVLNTLTVNSSNQEHGEVKVNRIMPDSYPWSGQYFGNMAVEIEAIPKRGYKFIGWSDDAGITSNNREVFPGTTTYTANFALDQEESSNVVINEIMYNADEEEETGDWVELYNTAGFEVDISGWQLKDEDDSHVYEFPNGTTMESDTYLVVSADLDDFNSQYSGISPLFGELGYGLAGGSDAVRLFDADGILVDSLSYLDEDPWDSGADGTGYTLELIDPNSDNSLPVSWEASSVLKGTPGAQNSAFLVSEEVEVSVPEKILLNQNYPNPFNPSTTISFEIPQSSYVRLVVFDMLGRKVSTLVDGQRTAGLYSQIWDAQNFASGIYMYALEVDGKLFTRRMMLIK